MDLSFFYKKMTQNIGLPPGELVETSIQAHQDKVSISIIDG